MATQIANATASATADAVWDEVVTDHKTTGTFGEAGGNASIPSSVSDPSAAAGTFKGAAGLSAVDNYYRYCGLVFTKGALKGVTRSISSYTGSTLAFTFNVAFPAAPANGDTFLIIGRVGA
jgi:hypothetical protein